MIPAAAILALAALSCFITRLAGNALDLTMENREGVFGTVRY